MSDFSDVNFSGVVVALFFGLLGGFVLAVSAIRYDLATQAQKPHTSAVVRSEGYMLSTQALQPAYNTIQRTDAAEVLQ